MKAFIFDPLWDELVTTDLTGKLRDNKIDIVAIKDVSPLHECTELFEGDEERLLCLNPDFVDWKLTSFDYKDIPHLIAILTASTGFEWIDKSLANERDIPICNIRNFSTEAVAEWAILMMLNLSRQIPKLIKDGFPLDYDKDFIKYRGIQLRGKTAAIIGLGNIGSAIAERCIGLGMNVIYWSKSSEDSKYKKTTLEELMKTADVIFPTVAKNNETLSLITDELLFSMKPSAIMVDIAHGLFEEAKLIKMVTDGKLFGYGYEGKPQKFSTIEGNIWSAPSYAWTTYESMYNSVVLQVDNIIAASKNQFPTRVN